MFDLAGAAMFDLWGALAGSFEAFGYVAFAGAFSKNALGVSTP